MKSKVILVVYVHVIIITDSDPEVLQSRHGILLSQRKCVLDLLEETGMLECRPVETPMNSNTKLCKSTEEEVNVKNYQRLMGRLIYLCVTRPNISYAVSVEEGSSIKIMDTSTSNDSQMQTGLDPRMTKKSTWGYCMMVGGNLVPWRSKKHNVVARSSAEAEYKAMAHTVSELLWIRSLLIEPGFYKETPMNLYCDNQIQSKRVRGEEKKKIREERKGDRDPLA
ncbi:uncharacterized mitochondrial protein AtMg00810-like [Aristolochia californica]|uniref:uncharacterized mitochondrial protein AtMg00810-like n=1 Tax=Aristolochia californica TaxID=171875 RepID=UPI0035D93C81